MSLASVGPVPLTHGNPTFAWTGRPQPGGFRECAIAGVAEWSRVSQLVELVDNADRSVPVGIHDGVLEHVDLTDDLLGPQRGWYLLHSVTLSADQSSSLGDLVQFSVAATRIGQSNRELVLARSSHMRANGFALAATAIVVDPLGRDATVANPFAWSPGGNYFTREYEGEDGTSRLLGMYAGLVSPSGDELNPIAHPTTDDRPDYGTDCRGYDRRTSLGVYGPAHRLARSTDLELRNGLVRAWVGPTGVPAYLTAYAFVDGVWHEAGILSVAEDAELLNVRLSRVTPSAITVTLTVRGQGDVAAILARGERQLRIYHSGLNAPRVVGWRGVPPTLSLDDAGNAPGRFGDGLLLAEAS